MLMAFYLQKERSSSGASRPLIDTDIPSSSATVSPWKSLPFVELERKGMDLGRHLAKKAGETSIEEQEKGERTRSFVSPKGFSTQGIHVGKIYERKPVLSSSPQDALPAYKPIGQLLDGPSLILQGSEEEASVYERLTLTALSHLPTGVLFLFDCSSLPSSIEEEEQGVEEDERKTEEKKKKKDGRVKEEREGRCPLSLKAQLHLRNQLRERFPRRPWIDVIAKADQLSLHQIDLAKKYLPPCLLLSTHSSSVSLLQVQLHARLLFIQLREILEKRAHLRQVEKYLQEKQTEAANEETEEKRITRILNRYSTRKRESSLSDTRKKA
ncbi:nucleolar gtp-binding protein 1 [Cystoisospora suis]|uniref:Nucleolar gtp-binding protein 1 n=1 Tax=Cystoisospora suis TaxID=483139 RepID=A0A2C6L0R0_9APIC|nr:nucleolar gtp-binding protein 1 [Cystoisospora suis]